MRKKYKKYTIQHNQFTIFLVKSLDPLYEIKIIAGVGNASCQSWPTGDVDPSYGYWCSKASC